MNYDDCTASCTGTVYNIKRVGPIFCGIECQIICFFYHENLRLQKLNYVNPPPLSSPPYFIMKFFRKNLFWMCLAVGILLILEKLLRLRIAFHVFDDKFDRISEKFTFVCCTYILFFLCYFFTGHPVTNMNHPEYFYANRE